MNMVSRSDVEIWRVPFDDSSLSCTCKPLELLQADKLKQVMCKIKPSSWLSKTSELCWGFVLVFTQLHGTYRYILAHDLPSFGRTCPFSESAFRRSTFGVRYWNGCLRGRTATVINLSVKVWDLTWENINRHKYSNIMCHNTVLIWIRFDFPILHCYWIAWGVRSWKIWKLNWTETERAKSIWRVNIYSNEQSSRARKNCNSPSVRTDPVHVCNENANVQKVSIVHALPWSHMCTMSHSHVSATVKVTAREKNQMLSFTCYSTWNLAYTGVGENKLVSSSAASD